MSLEGMDVDELRGLAAQLDTDLQTLNRLVGTVNGLAGRLPAIWHGSAASAFETDWASKYRPGLVAAVSTLTSLHAHLVNNLNQQESASAAEGGWTPGSIPGELRTAWDANEKWGSPVEGPLGVLQELSSDKYKVGTPEYGHYNAVWSKLIDLDHDGPLLKYHESSAFRYVHDAIHDSSVLRDVHDASFVEKSASVLAKTHLAEYLGPVGIGLAVADASVNTGQAIVAVHDGDYNSAIQHVGSAVQDAGPVGFLAGGDIKLLADDYQLGSQINWSQGLPNPLSGGNLMTEYVPSIAEAPLKTLDIVKNAFL